MTKTGRIACLVFAAALSCVSAARADLLVAQYNPAVNDRFYTGSDKAFIGDAVTPPLDFSGVGYTSDGHWVTMVSPSYFLSAEHYHPAPGTTVTFYIGNSTAQSYTFTVGSWSYETSIPGMGPSDLYMGELTAPIPASDNIANYPIDMLGADSNYFGRQLYVYGVPNKVGTNTIADIYPLSYSGHVTQLMEYDYNPSIQYDAFLEGGDSGGPSFLVQNGKLALVGIHYVDATFSGGSPDYSGDSFVPYYAAQLDAQMTGEQLTLVPEPGGARAVGQWGLVGADLGTAPASLSDFQARPACALQPLGTVAGRWSSLAAPPIWWQSPDFHSGDAVPPRLQSAAQVP